MCSGAKKADRETCTVRIDSAREAWKQAHRWIEDRVAVRDTHAEVTVRIFDSFDDDRLVASIVVRDDDSGVTAWTELDFMAKVEGLPVRRTGWNL